MALEKCGGCAGFVLLEGDNPARQGTCHGAPPQVAHLGMRPDPHIGGSMSDHFGSQWPLVTAETVGCFAFRADSTLH